MTDRGESGQVAILVLGMALVVLAIVGLTVDGTRAFLHRRTLQNVADGAAAGAAAQIDRPAYYSSGGSAVRIHAAGARRAALTALAARGVQARVGWSSDDTGVRLVLRAELPTTFLRLVGISFLPVAVESVAEPVALP